MIRLFAIRTARFYMARSNARARAIEFALVRADLDAIHSEVWRWRYRALRRFGWVCALDALRRRPRRWFGGADFYSPTMRAVAADRARGPLSPVLGVQS